MKKYTIYILFALGFLLLFILSAMFYVSVTVGLITMLVFSFIAFLVWVAIKVADKYGEEDD